MPATVNHDKNDATPVKMIKLVIRIYFLLLLLIIILIVTLLYYIEVLVLYYLNVKPHKYDYSCINQTSNPILVIRLYYLNNVLLHY